MCTATGLTNIGLLDTTAGDADTNGRRAGLVDDDARHIAMKIITAMMTAAATATLI